jgi:hypothetical protein
MEVNDTRPGKAPTIQTERDRTTITFVIGEHNGQTLKLVLRCERSGEMYSAITLK